MEILGQGAKAEAVDPREKGSEGSQVPVISVYFASAIYWSASSFSCSALPCFALQQRQKHGTT